MSPRDRQRAPRSERRKPAPAPDLLEDTPAPRPPLRVFSHLFTLLRGGTLLGLAAACIGVFYIAVILGEAQDLQRAAGQQPAATAMPQPQALPGGQRSYETTDIAQLEALLPARLATLPAQQGFQLESGKAEDLRIPGVTAPCRAVTLVYRHAALRDRVVVHSAVPGGYLQRFAQQDYTLGREPVTLGPLPAILLTTEDRQYYIATQGEAVFVLEGLPSTPDLTNIPGWVMLSGIAADTEQEQAVPAAVR